jgi:hypothetical protein
VYIVCNVKVKVVARHRNNCASATSCPRSCPVQDIAKEQGTVALGGSQPQAEVPIAVEAWARKMPSGSKDAATSMSRASTASRPSPKSPGVTATVTFACGDLVHACSSVRKKGSYAIIVNVTTPNRPITCDGKAPNLEPFADTIQDAVAAANIGRVLWVGDPAADVDRERGIAFCRILAENPL